jgi:hypothetical protein
MSTRVALGVLFSCLALVVSGCTQAREIPVEQHVVPSVLADKTGGSAIVALPYPQTLFGPPLISAMVQPATMKLKDLILSHPRLEVTPLASSQRTVALALRESASGDERWGEVMIPQERKLFLRFATDRSLGDWLIMITDVEVTDGPDAVPLVAYRWDRGGVEAYAECGIPQSTLIEDCTHAFFSSANVVFLIRSGQPAGQ